MSTTYAYIPLSRMGLHSVECLPIGELQVAYNIDGL